MPCKRVENLVPCVRNLACRGLTFVPLDGAAPLLAVTYLNIAATNKALLPLLDS